MSDKKQKPIVNILPSSTKATGKGVRDESNRPKVEYVDDIEEPTVDLSDLTGIYTVQQANDLVKEISKRIIEAEVPELGQGNSVGEKIVREIQSGTHGSMEEAMESVLEEIGTGKGTTDYYFMVFDMNNDFSGSTFAKIEKRRISYNNEMELQGHIGGTIEKLSDTPDKMVMFLNRDRAVELMQKVAQFEQIDHNGIPLKSYDSEYKWLVEHADDVKTNLVSGKGWIRDLSQVDFVEDMMENLSTDPGNALKFDTKGDAEIFIQEHSLEDDFIANEHEYLF